MGAGETHPCPARFTCRAAAATEKRNQSRCACLCPHTYAHPGTLAHRDIPVSYVNIYLYTRVLPFFRPFGASCQLGARKHYYLHRSHLTLETAAWACPGATRVLEIGARACPGGTRALEMAARACKGAARAFEMTAQAWPGAAKAIEMAARASFGAPSALETACHQNARNRRSGLPQCHQSARNGRSGLPRCFQSARNGRSEPQACPGATI